MIPLDNLSPTSTGGVDFLLLIAVLHSRTVGELVFVGVTVGATVGVGATVVTGATVGVGATVVTGATVGVGIGAGETVAVVVNDAASLPAVSCIAELDVAEFEVGAVYTTEMTSPITAGVPSVKITVDPLTEIELTVIDVVPTETVKSPATAVVALIDSLNVRVTCVPAVFAVAELKVGAVVSMTIACAPAMLLDPVGNEVEFIALPAASVGADVSAYDVTVKSALLSPAPTV
jgi:hypothetical protein